jgi:HTH-type transcriptional regulator / antitoxin HigA
MKTTLIAIENDADHIQAKALVGKLMGSRRSDDRVRLVAQARLIEAYERSRWPRSLPTLPDLLNQMQRAPSGKLLKIFSLFTKLLHS